MTEKMEIYSIVRPKQRINIEKSVVDQRKGNFMQKKLLSPVERLEDETGDSDSMIIMKFILIQWMNSNLTKHMMTKLMKK